MDDSLDAFQTGKLETKKIISLSRLRRNKPTNPVHTPSENSNNFLKQNNIKGNEEKLNQEECKQDLETKEVGANDTLNDVGDLSYDCSGPSHLANKSMSHNEGHQVGEDTAQQEKDAISSGGYCSICNLQIPKDKCSSHYAECLRLKFSSKQDVKLQLNNQTRCPMCGHIIDISQYELHVEECKKINLQAARKSYMETVTSSYFNSSQTSKSASVEANNSHYTCPSCSKNLSMFDTPARSRHVNRCLDTRVSVLKFPIRRKLFDKNSHASRHTDNGPSTPLRTNTTQCSDCGKTLKTKRGLNLHIKRCPKLTVHVPGDAEPKRKKKIRKPKNEDEDLMQLARGLSVSEQTGMKARKKEEKRRKKEIPIPVMLEDSPSTREAALQARLAALIGLDRPAASDSSDIPCTPALPKVSSNKWKILGSNFNSDKEENTEDATVHSEDRVNENCEEQAGDKVTRPVTNVSAKETFAFPGTKLGKAGVSIWGLSTAQNILDSSYRVHGLFTQLESSPISPVVKETEPAVKSTERMEQLKNNQLLLTNATPVVRDNAIGENVREQNEKEDEKSVVTVSAERGFDAAASIEDTSKTFECDSDPCDFSVNSDMHISAENDEPFSSTLQVLMELNKLGSERMRSFSESSDQCRIDQQLKIKEENTTKGTTSFPEKYCHSSNHFVTFSDLSASFQTLINNPAYSDLTLAFKNELNGVEDDFLYLHKCVLLCRCQPLLQALELQQGPDGVCRVSFCSKNEFMPLLHYLYSATSTQICTVEKILEKFGIFLYTHKRTYTDQHRKSTTKSNSSPKYSECDELQEKITGPSASDTSSHLLSAKAVKEKATGKEQLAATKIAYSPKLPAAKEAGSTPIPPHHRDNFNETHCDDEPRDNSRATSNLLPTTPIPNAKVIPITVLSDDEDVKPRSPSYVISDDDLFISESPTPSSDCQFSLVISDAGSDVDKMHEINIDDKIKEDVCFNEDEKSQTMQPAAFEEIECTSENELPPVADRLNRINSNETFGSSRALWEATSDVTNKRKSVLISPISRSGHKHMRMAGSTPFKTLNSEGTSSDSANDAKDISAIAHSWTCGKTFSVPSEFEDPSDSFHSPTVNSLEKSGNNINESELEIEDSQLSISKSKVCDLAADEDHKFNAKSSRTSLSQRVNIFTKMSAYDALPSFTQPAPTKYRFRKMHKTQPATALPPSGTAQADFSVNDSASLASALEHERSSPETTGQSKKGDPKTPRCSTMVKNGNRSVPITPMPNFSDLDTPEIVKQGKRIGLKNLGKKKLKIKLKEAHAYTHQVETSYEDTPVKTKASTSSIVNDKPQKRSDDDDDDDIASDTDCEIIGTCPPSFNDNESLKQRAIKLLEDLPDKEFQNQFSHAFANLHTKGLLLKELENIKARLLGIPRGSKKHLSMWMSRLTPYTQSYSNGSSILLSLSQGKQDAIVQTFTEFVCGDGGFSSSDRHHLFHVLPVIYRTMLRLNENLRPL